MYYSFEVQQSCRAKPQRKELEMFESATRRKVRFDTPNGQLSVEDLWDLPLTSNRGRANLDDIARGLHKQLKNSDDVSFVDTDRKSDSIVQLKFDIVKHIIGVKLADRATAAVKAENDAKKARIMELIAQRQDEALSTKSVEELTEMLKDM